MIKALVCDQWLKTLFVAFMWGAQLNPLCLWPTIWLKINQYTSLELAFTTMSMWSYYTYYIMYILCQLVDNLMICKIENIFCYYSYNMVIIMMLLLFVYNFCDM